MVSCLLYVICSYIQPDIPSRNLFVNGQLVVDQSTDPEEGDLFFGVSTKEVRGVIHGLEANKKYDMEIRTTTSQLDPRGSPFTSRGGIRVGAMRRVKEEDAIRDAVDLAKKSDGEFYELFIKLLFTNV